MLPRYRDPMDDSELIFYDPSNFLSNQKIIVMGQRSISKESSAFRSSRKVVATPSVIHYFPEERETMKRHCTTPSLVAISLLLALVLLSSSLLAVNVVAASSLRASSPSPSSVFDDIDVVLDDVIVGTTVSDDGDSSSDDHPDDVKIVEQQPTTTSSLTIKLSTHYHSKQSSTTSYGRTKDSISELPLVGIGVGNIPHFKVPYVLAVALDAASGQQQQQSGKTSPSVTSELNYRLIDTSRRAESALEVLVGRSLSRISSSTSNDNDTIYHIMIKIWHTHLGYERTMLSVRDSLSDILPGTTTKSDVAGSSGHHPDVRVHAILQYPRCYDELFASPAYINSPNLSTKYTNCAEEEDALEDSIKRVDDDTSPLADRDGAWKRSYRALEELYHRGVIESIGIGDFGPSDLAELFDLATVGPHVYQGSLRTLLTQEVLVEELVRHGVHYQCYDVVSTMLTGRDGAPVAFSRLERIGARHGGLEEEDGDGYSPIQVVLGYLVHHRGVGVIPGTTNDVHLAENSPSSLGNMQRFGPREVLDIETSLLALVNGQDDTTSDATTVKNARGEERVITATGSSFLEEADDTTTMDGHVAEGGVVATFFNTLPHPRSVRIFQVHPSTGEQIQLSHGIPPGRSGRMIVNIDDVLIAYDGHGVAVKKFLVEKLSGKGESVDFIIDSL